MLCSEIAWIADSDWDPILLRAEKIEGSEEGTGEGAEEARIPSFGVSDEGEFISSIAMCKERKDRRGQKGRIEGTDGEERNEEEHG